MKQGRLMLGVIGVMATLVACSAQDGSSEEPSGNARVIKGVSKTPTAPVTGTDGGAVDASVGTSDAGPAGCYAGRGACEPTNPTSCAKGQACDINGSTDSFECFDPPNDAQLGDACNNSSGPFCAHGLACNGGVCAQYCCDDSVCASGTTCTETGTVGTISIKVCL